MLIIYSIFIEFLFCYYLPPYRAGRKACVMIGMVIASIMSIAAVVCQIYEKNQDATDGMLWEMEHE